MYTRFAKFGGTALLMVLACLGLSAAASAKPQAPQQVHANLGNLSPVGEAVFHPISPVRVLDTRDGTGGKHTKFTAGSTFNLQVTGSAIPTGASAVVVNLITVHSTAVSYLTVFPAGATRPLAAAMLVPVGGPANNMATSALSAAGQMAIYDNGTTVDVIVDVEGYYAPSVAVGPSGYQGWIVANDSETVDSYASNGLAVTVTNSDIGINVVTFTGANIGAFLVASADIQVSAATNVGYNCSTLAGAPNANLNVTVYCFDLGGNRVNALFYLHVSG
jgi:hypothetical protein